MAEYIVGTDEHEGHWLTGERVVRCEDCKHMYERYPFNSTCCDRVPGGLRVEPDGFCAWGERKEGANV